MPGILEELQGGQVAGAESVGKGRAADEVEWQGAEQGATIENHGLLFRMKWEGTATLQA